MFRRTLEFAARILIFLAAFFGAFAINANFSPLRAEEPATAEPQAKAEEQPAHFRALEEMLTGATLRGHFTMNGQATDKLTEERYEIQSVKKLPEGDLWMITTRIQYGERDLTLPIPLAVKWAGDTPVITLDAIKIPGLGTFGARVVLHDGKYAGTWSHDDKGGHLFGVIEKEKNE